MATDGDLRRLHPEFIEGSDVNFTLALRTAQVAALALHSHRRDLALYRVGYVSRKTRGLLWYYNRLQREMVTGFFKAAFSHGAAQAAKSRMSDILAEAEEATFDRKLELLAEAERLQARLQELTGSVQ